METDAEERDYYRREAMGAFAHEIRTPLTSLRMVIALARRQAGVEGTLALDAELAAMLEESIDDLQRLADDLQDQSRLERGKAKLGVGPCDLAAAMDAAREMLPSTIDLERGELENITGPWDAPRLVRAIAGFAESANRIGDGCGRVRFEYGRDDSVVTLLFASGLPAVGSKPIAADAGFSFFRARQYVLAAGGEVEVERGERSAAIRVKLPLEQGTT